MNFLVSTIFFGKFSAIVGPAIMALTSTLTGNVRLSMLGIIPLFVIGLIIFMALPADQWRDSEVLE